jgi:two-component system chemotaxis sensor kinase CheA
MVADRLLEPLKHLVRNALDHGVESPAERRRNGKSHRARIDLEAWQEHGKVNVRVRDDGRGLDLTRIEKVAVERGLIPSGRKLGEQEACALLLVPGFTTRDQVSPLSGRGVGLDVVRQNIYDLGGELDVKTEQGVGISVTLSVPLTLAMVEGITLQCEQQLFSFPLDVVERIIRPSAAQCLRLPGGEEVIRVSGASVPLLRLEKLLHLQTHAPTSHASSQPTVVVLVASLHRSLAIAADSVVSQEPLLLKGFPRTLRASPALLATATISTGQTTLLLDVAALESSVREPASDSSVASVSHLDRRKKPHV